MSDDWDFYACRVDNEPASIFFDLGIAVQAPLAEFPHMAYVRLRMRSPRSDGLSSQEEYETLIKIEDQLSRALNQPSASVYVGRNTSGGCRDFYFYTQTANDWDHRVETAMTNFVEYVFETGSRPDPDWTTYLTFLYPSGEAMRRIQNRRVCDNLQKKGDSLTHAREIDHWTYFPDARSRAAFIDQVSKSGFTVRELREHPDSRRRFGVQLYRVDLPSFENIDAITLPLYQAATDAGGDYDGWETQVVNSRKE
jgi:uncharacterized protein (TIGR01619 family)